MTATGAIDRSVPEHLQVRRWRRQKLRDMGFSAAEARLLERSGVDLADARRLLCAGCPPETARRILL